MTTRNNRTPVEILIMQWADAQEELESVVRFPAISQGETPAEAKVRNAKTADDIREWIGQLDAAIELLKAE